MRILLLHPEDSVYSDPWSAQHWDLIVDLGNSTPSFQKRWVDLFGCPVLCIESYRYGLEDARQVRQEFSGGCGRLIDEDGIDWWQLTSLVFISEALDVLALRRMTSDIPKARELWSTRRGGRAVVLANLLGRPLRTFGTGPMAKFAAAVDHYATFFRQFPVGQIKEIFLDKYDPGYRWRSRLASTPERYENPVVLIPSAYANVSRMAADYALLLPQQAFLVVATRRSATRFNAPANVTLRHLTPYARKEAGGSELSSLIERWVRLQKDLGASPLISSLSQAGFLEPLQKWIQHGISVRDAWRNVLDREPVYGVLCGDDSNPFTRLPVLLAARRKIPTADFHHGAFDGRYLFKELPSDIYLAKNEMERDYLLRVCGLPVERVLVAPPHRRRSEMSLRSDSPRQSLVWFSEAYESVGIRGEEFYRELLPRLLDLARQNQRGLIIKLHPFESTSQRKRLVRKIVGAADSRDITILEGPLSPDLLAQTWCGITVESTTVMDCWLAGVCCFICGWLTLSPYEYTTQYGRFGVGQVLQNLEQIAEIPRRLADFHNHPRSPVLTEAPDATILQRWLNPATREFATARSEA